MGRLHQPPPRRTVPVDALLPQDDIILVAREPDGEAEVPGCHPAAPSELVPGPLLQPHHLELVLQVLQELRLAQGLHLKPAGTATEDLQAAKGVSSARVSDIGLRVAW